MVSSDPLVRVSLNQIEHTARKAARGAGLSWSTAEDTGRAVRWLEQYNCFGIARLIELIDSYPDLAKASQNISCDNGKWSSNEAIVSPFIAGPAVCDRLAQADLEITIENLLSPILTIGYLGSVMLPTDQAVLIRWDNISCRVAHGSFATSKGQIGNSDLTPKRVEINRENYQGSDHYTEIIGDVGSRDINVQLWRALELFAHRTYVEATEESRLAGAGAGLNDND